MALIKKIYMEKEGRNWQSHFLGKSFEFCFSAKFARLVNISLYQVKHYMKPQNEICH